jgi:hypothetical protein
MKYSFFIAGAALTLAACLVGSSARAQDAAQSPSPAAQASPGPSIPLDQKNARQAHELIDKAIKALGGDAYLKLHDMQQQGRTYSFYHGRPSGNGVFFWRFVEYPDKERIELTPQRDIAYVYIGDKGYELTYKGARAVEKKDMDDYLRRRKFSLDTVLRTWVNDPTVALFYDGSALAGNLAAEKVTLIDAHNEAVSVYFDIDTHLPIKKTYSWRDPADKERNLEEETFDNYRPIDGVMIAFGFTRYYNGDMQSERFVNAAHCNQGLNPAMFDPNSGYNPIKEEGKKGKH